MTRPRPGARLRPAGDRRWCPGTRVATPAQPRLRSSRWTPEKRRSPVGRRQVEPSGRGVRWRDRSSRCSSWGSDWPCSVSLTSRPRRSSVNGWSSDTASSPGARSSRLHGRSLSAPRPRGCWRARQHRRGRRWRWAVARSASTPDYRRRGALKALVITSRCRRALFCSPGSGESTFVLLVARAHRRQSVDGRVEEVGRRVEAHVRPTRSDVTTRVASARSRRRGARASRRRHSGGLAAPWA